MRPDTSSRCAPALLPGLSIAFAPLLALVLVAGLVKLGAL